MFRHLQRMYRHRHKRPSPFADFINWTDYRWDSNPRRAGGGPPPFGAFGAPPQQRRYGLLQVVLAGVAVLLGIKLMSSLRNSGNRSWIERGILAVLLLMVASYVSKRARQRGW